MIDPIGGYAVCIGASIGGLDALEIFSNICVVADGAAIVVGQSVSRAHLAISDSVLEDTDLEDTALPLNLFDVRQVVLREQGIDTASNDLGQHGLLGGSLSWGTVS